MRGLHDTIARLGTKQQQDARSSHLVSLDEFGSNPGALKAWAYVPQSFRPGSPLVVVLHGCTQTAAGYDRGSGWSRAADDHGFALLYPEQTRANNPNLCFNWFQPRDTARGHGEALSIRQMIAAMQARHRTDPKRVFVTGLSAGGAMAMVMLAAYPDVFAGGGIVAGLPFGTASSVPEALEQMRGHAGPGGEGLARIVRNASGHDGGWPTISVWHGSADRTVDNSNARAIVDQWRTLHGAGASPSRVSTINGHRRETWCDGGGREVIEYYSVIGMGHGTPLDLSGDQPSEQPGPHMLNAGISSTRRMAEFWNVADGVSRGAPLTSSQRRPDERLGATPAPSKDTSATSAVQSTIEKALRTAGLMS